MRTCAPPAGYRALAAWVPRRHRRYPLHRKDRDLPLVRREAGRPIHHPLPESRRAVGILVTTLMGIWTDVFLAGAELSRVDPEVLRDGPHGSLPTSSAEGIMPEHFAVLEDVLG